MTYERFMESCPKELEPFLEAHKLKIQEQDYMNWLSNQYTLSAVSVAVEHCLAGKKAMSEYIRKPILQEAEKENNSYIESNEEVAVFEMKQRINALRKQGLPESPM